MKLSGFTAPSCGLAVRLWITDNRNVYRYYVIPAGKSSVNFSLPCFTEGSVNVNADFYTKDRTVSGNASCNATADSGGSCSGADITVLKQHPITGTIRLPNGIESAGVHMQINCRGEDASTSTNVGIREGGGTAAKYRIYVREGEEYRFGLNAGKSTSENIGEGYLYTDSNWKQSKKGEPVSVDGAKSGVDFTLSRAVYVSGVFVAQDGGEVIPDPEANYHMLFSTGSDNIWTSSEISMGEGGTWSVRTPEGMTGELYMYFNSNAGYQGNIVAASYYYSSGPEALTNRENAEPVTVAETGASDVRIVVKTGYRITGRVLLPEGGNITFNQNYSHTSFPIYAKAQGEGENRRGQFVVKDGEMSFPYNIIVPRTRGEYTIEYPSSAWSSYIGTTNVAFSAAVSAEKTVKVTDRDVVGPDITLQLIKATVTGTVSRPADITGYLSCTVQVATEKDSYKGSVAIKDGEDSGDFTITVPDGDKSETYTVYYTTGSSGLMRTGYLTASGVSQEQSESAKFSFSSDSLHHGFTLLVTPVAAQGRIYFPKDVTAKFNVYINAANSSVSVTVEPSSCKSSGEYKYADYSIRNANVGVNYKIYCSVSEYSGEYSGLYTNRSFYIDENGELTSDYTKAKLFYYEGKAVTQDFYLIKWDDGSENYLIQSEHGVKHEGDSVTYTYTYTYPGECSTLTVHSVAHSDSTVSVKGSQENYDRYLSGGSAITVRGNSITVKYTRSTSYSARYGFAIDSIIPDGVTRTDTGVAALCSQTGSGLDAVLEAVNGGKALNAVAVGPEGVVANVAAAAYDAEGRMLAVKLAEAELSPNGAPLQMQFKKVSSAAEVKVFILGADSTPAAEVYIPAAQAS